MSGVRGIYYFLGWLGFFNDYILFEAIRGAEHKRVTAGTAAIKQKTIAYFQHPALTSCINDHFFYL